MNSPYLEYLYSLDRLGIKPGLERMEVLMEALGHPEQKFKSIHISGTNGKGSVAAMIESVLRKLTTLPSGHPSFVRRGKIGLYTSPDIYSFHERIRVNGEAISDGELASLVWELKDITEQSHVEPTFFEFTTALCYLYFARQEVDMAVVEVGMGGLLDATNVIMPLVSVITNIGLDHQEFLGDTKEKIAVEKAGIIKRNVPVVTGEKTPSILQILEQTAQKKNAPFIKAYERVHAEVLEASLEGQRVRVKILDSPAKPGYDSTEELFLPLLGKHQVENLKVALAALDVLKQTPHHNLQHGIAATKWEGRLDVVSRDPLIIVDGAHNADGVGALAAFLPQLPSRDVLIVGVKQGRDIADLARLIVAHFSHVIVTAGNYQPEKPEALARKLSAATGRRDIVLAKNAKQAIALGKKLLPAHGTMLITGSLYLVADALAVLRGKRSHS